MRRTLLRGGAVLTAAAVVVLALAAPAAAHVTVNPSNATQGGYTKVAFRVPNEKDSAQTVKVEINLPTDAPIASVALKPLTGWTGTTEKSKLATPIKTDDGEITEAVTKITWTAAAGAAIQPAQFQEFEVSLGPLPAVDQIIFKALQTYSDGDIVRWIDEPKADGSEPQHPAPTLKLAKSTAADTHAATATATQPATAATASDASSSSGAGTWLGIAGVILGLAGLVAGLLGYRKAATRQ
jgi:periplasmic copper chaperone A